MVASSQPLATAAGLQVLQQGGNAADAAVATAAALNVTEPNMTGIGGDCFALYYEAATGRVTALNGSGRAPAGLSLERLAGEGIRDALPEHHAHTVTVPGACAGWCDLVARHGSLSMQRDTGAGDRAGRAGLSRGSDDGDALVDSGGDPAPALTRRAGAHDRRARPPPRRDLPQPDPRRHPAAGGGEGQGGLLPGRGRRGHRTSGGLSRWCAQRGGPGGPHIDLGRADQHQLPGPSRLGVSTEWPGPGGAAGAEHPSRLRSGWSRTPWKPTPPPDDRGDAAGLRRRALVRGRPRRQSGSSRRAALGVVRRRAEEADPARSKQPRYRSRRPIRRIGHRLPVRRRRPGQRLLLHQQQLHGLRHRAGARGLRLQPAEPRCEFQSRSGTSQCAGAGQAPLSHHHSGAPHARVRWQSVRTLRCDGRLHAAPGPPAGGGGDGGRRSRPPGGAGPAALQHPGRSGGWRRRSRG